MIVETKAAPDLRFPEFDDQWPEAKLGALATTVTSGSRDWAQYYSDKGSKFVRMTNLPRGGIQLLLDDLRFVELPEDSSEGKRTSLEVHDLLISITAELGKIGLIPPGFGAAYINQHTALVRLDLTRSDARFVAHNLSSQRMNNMINRLNDAGAKAGLNLPTIRSFKLHTPTLPEQRKIADFLTAVDGRIGQLIQKRALLEDYKKGVMQQLFTQAIRFQDDHGNDFPDWEEKKLGEVYSYITTNSLSRDCLNYESGEVFNIHYGDIHTKFRSHFYLSKENVPYLNDSAEELRIKDECYVKAGDIVLADASEDYADIGKSIEILDTEDQQIVAGLHTYILRPDLTQMAIGFGAYLMQARPTRLGVMTVAQGTKVLGLPKGYLAGITLNIPTPDEQTKIANFLSAIDRKIESVATQITETQTFKRGLLQQMFV